MKIKKHSGDLVNFDQDKLRRSMLRSGADSVLVDNIVASVKESLYLGMPTKAIYKLAFKMLRARSRASAARYNLREAIRMLGPAGFYFEKYVARIFDDHEYQTRLNLKLQGRCVLHEVDVAIKAKEQVTMVECKFHMRRESVSDVKVPMYILSRFNDLKSMKHQIFTDSDKIAHCIIATNNRFTLDAINFAQCNKLELLSWDYPAERNLRTLNNGRNLYPITAMTTLTMGEKDLLLKGDIVLARELAMDGLPLQHIGISASRIKNIMAEAEALRTGTL